MRVLPSLLKERVHPRKWILRRHPSALYARDTQSPIMEIVGNKCALAALLFRRERPRRHCCWRRAKCSDTRFGKGAELPIPLTRFHSLWIDTRHTQTAL